MKFSFTAAAIVLATPLHTLAAPAHSYACHKPAGEVGAAFALTNDPADNLVVAYSRDKAGKLTEVATYSTGGRGQGVDFDTQGGLTLSDDRRYLYAVSPADDKVTVFAVQGSCLKLLQVIYAGDQPLSFTIRGDYAYALDGSVASTGIFGFAVSSDGTLAPLTNETIPTSTPIGVPGTILFDLDGKSVVVTNKVGSTLDYFPLGADGIATGPVTSKSAGPRPFAAWYNKDGTLLVIESGLPELENSGVSTYSTRSSGKLAPITRSAKNHQTDGCWIISTLDGKYAYTANFVSGSVSSYSLGADGSAALINGVASNQGVDSNPVDLAISADGKYLYNLLRGYGSVKGHLIRPDGSLKLIGEFGRGQSLLPAYGVSGFAAF